MHIVTPPFQETGLDHTKQNHEPLAFLSGHFNDTQLGWSTLEKEGYAIMASTRRMHWVLPAPEGFDLYTDHNHLVFILDPLAVMQDLSKTSVKKVMRCAVQLSFYNYVFFHIKGKENVWADLLSRWMPKILLRRLVFVPPLVTAFEENFDRPSLLQIKTYQMNYKKMILKQKLTEENKNEKYHLLDLTLDEGLLKNKNGLIWIPDNHYDLQLRICIIGHTGPAGHRGYKNTLSNIREMFTWNTLAADVKLFVDKCIHCISTTKGTREPRPFGPALYGTSANDLIQYDYIEMGPSTTGMKYLLLMRDDFSSYCWFLPFSNANSENAADALLEWATTFNTPKGLISDGGTHFKNETVRILTKSI